MGRAAGLPKRVHGVHHPPLLRRPKRLPQGQVLWRWSRRKVALGLSLSSLAVLCSLTVISRPDLSTRLGVLATFDIANRDSRGTAIICLGDSVTQGIGASPGRDYPRLLSAMLGQPVINAGVDGDETADALKRLDADVLATHPRLVIVELGADDFLDGIPMRQAFANLDEIVRRIQTTGAMVTVVGFDPPFLEGRLRKDYERLIRARHVAFVPAIYRNIWANPQFTSDALHPNDRGYALIAQRIYQVVAPLLR